MRDKMRKSHLVSCVFLALKQGYAVVQVDGMAGAVGYRCVPLIELCPLWKLPDELPIVILKPLQQVVQSLPIGLHVSILQSYHLQF
jgi:hypothetical protein